MFKLVVLQLALFVAVAMAQKPDPPMPMPGPEQMPMPMPMPSKLTRVARQTFNPMDMSKPGGGNGQGNNGMGSLPGGGAMMDMMKTGQDMAREVGDKMMSTMGGRRRRNI